MKLRNSVGVAWFIGAAMLLAGTAPVQAEYGMTVSFPGYNNRTEVLTNFPVLVVLSNGCDSAAQFNYGTFLSPNGYDLRFRDAGDTTNLDYEIEAWNTNGPSYVWVRVPALASDGTGSILARWGADSTQFASTTNGAVWTNAYVAVYHLATANGSLSAADATRVNNGSVVGDPAATDGMMDGGGSFTSAGYNDIDIPDNPSLRISGKITLSAWVKQTSRNSNGSMIIQKRNPTIHDGDDGENYSMWLTSSGNLNLEFQNPRSSYQQLPSTGVVPLGAWTYVTIAVDESAPAKLRMYLNGQLDSTPVYPSSMLACTSPLQMGNYGAAYGGIFSINGSLDEVRISSLAQSSNWVWACYQNQASNQVFSSIGAAQPLSVASQQMKITFAGYTNRTAVLTNFPVLVVLSNNVGGSSSFNFDKFVTSNGTDLRFVASLTDTNSLNYEIETWNTNAGQASYVWVQVPTIPADGSGAIWAKWGDEANSNRLACTTNGSTWSDSFRGVWHLDEPNSGPIYDSTINHFDGTQNGNIQTAGVINQAQDFNGSAKIQLGAVMTMNAYSKEAWVRVTGNGNLISGSGSHAFWVPGGQLEAGHNSDWGAVTDPVAFPMSSWQHVAVTYDSAVNGGQLTLYRNGVQVAAASGKAAPAPDGTCYFGSFAGGNYFTGKIDEGRISSIARSADWVWACYLNQASNQVFSSYDPVESLAQSGAVKISNSVPTNITVGSAYMNGTLAANGASPASVFLLWGTSDGTTNLSNWANINDFGVNAQPCPVSYSTNITTLASNTLYYYRYYASNDTEMGWATPSKAFINGGVGIQKTADASESGLAAGTFTVYRATSATNAALTLTYLQTGGTAGSGTNFTALPGTVTIPAGATTASIVVSPLVDWANTNDTTLGVTLTAGSPLCLFDASSNASMTIANGYTPNIWVAAAAGNASVPGNWSLGHVPTSGEAVLLAGNSVKNMTWDAAAGNTVAGWGQTAEYTGTVTIATTYSQYDATFTNLFITGDCVVNNGTWTHQANPSGNTAMYRLAVTIGGTFALGSAAQVNVDSRGFQQSCGPGSVGANDNAGPSHGGQGGFRSDTTPTPTYGSALQPTTLGSGGSTGGGGGTGGGAVQLAIGGPAQLDGSILARGGTSNTRPASGGSIFITAGTVSGSGTLDVRSQDIGGWSGGGGGRIAVVLNNGTTFGSLTMRANGGAGGPPSQHGVAGTIYQQTKDQSFGHGSLLVDNTGCPASTLASTIPAEAMNLSDLQALVLTNGGTFVVATNTSIDFATANISGGGELKVRGTNGVAFPSTFVVTPAYRLSIDTDVSASGNWTISSNAVVSQSSSLYQQADYRCSLTLNGNLTIAAGGAIDVSSRGYATGPGAGGGDPLQASHGGQGGHQPGYGPTATYGSALQPMTPGSGSATGGGSAPGGGVVRLAVSGTTLVNGSILAVGGFSASGGSIFLTTGTLSGNGLLNASGGNSGWPGGGGGRIAVILTSGSSFDSVAMRAYGGISGYSGAAGTVYRQVASQPNGMGNLFIDNDGIGTASDTLTLIPPALLVATNELLNASVILTNNSRMALSTNVGLGGLTLGTSSSLELAGHTGTVAALTITNRSFTGGTYTASDLGGLVSDSSGGNGRVLVVPAALYVDDTAVIEGASGTTTNASFQIRLLNVGVPVTLDYYTTNGTATGGSDFVATSGSMTIPLGVAQTNINVVVNGDDLIEPDETFKLVVTNVVGTLVAKSEGTCTISNDDARTISIDDTLVEQPISGTTTVVFTVTLSQAIGTDVTFTYNTLDGSATVADGDYNQVSGGVGTIPAGQTTTPITITINGDPSAESIETFNVVLSNPSGNATLGASTGACTVINNNGPPVLSITNLVSVTEGNSGTTNAVFTVWLSQAPASRVTFRYDTYDGAATTNDHDYVGISAGEGVLEVGQAQTTIVVQVNGDLKVEPTERFYVVLSNPTNAVIVNAVTGACDIVNDDYPFVWSGAAGDGLASTITNWLWNGAPATRLPTSADEVVLNGTSSSNLTWDAAASSTVVSWLQTASYSGTVTFATTYPEYDGTFTNFSIVGDCVISNGVWTHRVHPSDNTAKYRMAITVGGNFTLGSTGGIDVTGCGYYGAQGPGAGGGDSLEASHGGQGGHSASYAPSLTYGSAFEPVTLGSGGLTGGPRCPGGGAVRLVVAGTSLINGSILAKGGAPAGSAGGSIYITSGTLGGTGTLDASGAGSGYPSAWSGGGGGRIAVILTNGTSFGSAAMRAFGGPAYYTGAAGTVYRQTKDQSLGHGSLSIDNSGVSTLAVTLPDEALNVSDLQELIVTNGGNFVVTTNTSINFASANIHGGGELKVRSTNDVVFPSPFVLTNTYRLCLDVDVSVPGNWTIISNAVVTHSGSYYQQVEPEYRCALTLGGNLTIDAGGAIDVSGRGYLSGPGSGSGDPLQASHGGQGGHTPDYAPTLTYGSALQPVTPGSGGATGGGAFPGGGVVRLVVSGTTLVNGSILAMGGVSASGGSIFLTTGTLSGNGVLNASGITSGWPGGGGGRIAVILTSSSSFGSVAMQAYGGASSYSGAAGTIYRQTASQSSGMGSLLIDNGSVSTGTNTVTLIPPALLVATNEMDNVLVGLTNNARVALSTNVTFGRLTMGGSTTLELAGNTGTVMALTISSQVYKNGAYPASALGGLVTDSSGGRGRVVVDDHTMGAIYLIR